MPAKLNCLQKSSLRYSICFNNQTDQEKDETEMEILEMEIIDGEIEEGGCEYNFNCLSLT